MGIERVDIDNLDYSFLEQAMIQLERLKMELKREEATKSLDRHRLFRYNPFEEIESNKRRILDQSLADLLETLGANIYNERPIFVVDRRKPTNFRNTDDGVVHLNSPEEVTMTAVGPEKKALMLFMISKMLELMKQDRYLSLRGLYYLSVDVCRHRSQYLSQTLDDLCCLMGCSRVHLRILSQPKGIVYGDLKFKLKNGETFDCSLSKEGTGLPTPQIPIVEMSSDAKCLIILEKDSILQRLLCQEDTSRFIKKYKVILFTARGYPDISSRAFLNLLWRHLKIPMLALTDADPHGMEIVCCYKFGCYSAAAEADHLALPQIRWLGLLPIDVEKHELPRSSTIRQNSYDTQKLNSLYKRPYLQKRPEWLHQLNILREMGRKAELESIDTNGEYLVRTYLPNKLRYASWL